MTIAVLSAQGPRELFIPEIAAILADRPEMDELIPAARSV
jgi:hypothetical protein